MMMNLRERMNRFYLDLIINELRLANGSCLQHVTYNSLLYLDIIAYRENCTVSSLAQALHVAKSAVTLKVKELEKMGLVYKTKSAHDARVYYLKVNGEALEEYKACDVVLCRALDELDKIHSAEEIGLLCSMLDRISEHFARERNEP